KSIRGRTVEGGDSTFNFRGSDKTPVYLNISPGSGGFVRACYRSRPMDASKIAELRAKWAEVEEPLQLGKFNPDLIPKLELKSFQGPITVETAVSPDCGFRLLKAAMESATTSLDIYIYNISAEHILEIIEQKVKDGLTVRLMYDPHDSGKKEFERLSQIDGLDFQTGPTYK